MEEEKIEISVNQEDVQNIINAYEKDLKYIEQLEQERNNYKELYEKEISKKEKLKEWAIRKIEQNTPNARWKHYNEDGFNDYDVENGAYLEMQPVNVTFKEVVEKMQEIEKGYTR